MNAQIENPAAGHAPTTSAPRAGTLVEGPPIERSEEILTVKALAFLTALHERFAAEREELLRRRDVRRAETARGHRHGSSSGTASLRADPSWRVAGPGPALRGRRVSIVAPTDRASAVVAMESGADAWLADHEDGTSPTWENVIGGQLTLTDAVRGWIGAVGADERPSVVLRPRGLHLEEPHLVVVDSSGRRSPAAAALVDAGLHLFHTAQASLDAGRGPCFSLPKLESAREARLWDRLFTYVERYLDLPHGSIRATVVVETVPAVFELEEILFELRDHCAGLEIRRRGYVTGLLAEAFDGTPRVVAPARDRITRSAPFLRAYSELLIATAHARGAEATGELSAFLPDPWGPGATRQALDRAAQDAGQEAADGFDSTHVVHPDLIAIARARFAEAGGPSGAAETAARPEVLLDLSSVDAASSPIPETGVQDAVRIAVKYLESWLRGIGSVTVDGRREDLASAEFAREQLRQWVATAVTTTDGSILTARRIDALITEVADAQAWAPDDRFHEAAEILRRAVLAEDAPASLVLAADAGAHAETER